VQQKNSHYHSSTQVQPARKNLVYTVPILKERIRANGCNHLQKTSGENVKQMQGMKEITDKNTRIELVTIRFVVTKAEGFMKG